MGKQFQQGFGRLIYLTLIKRVSNASVQSKKWTAAELDKLSTTPTGVSKDGESLYDNITICFDPSREDQKGQLNTRIDFYVKHMGDAGVGNNGYYTTANIDVYNIGPGIQQFLDAYNAYQSKGHFKDVNTKKYAAILQVGYKDTNKRVTVFAGHISSFVLDRQQNNSTIDNVWHFFCQYPDAQQNGEVGSNRAQSGTDYATEYGDTFMPAQTYTSWENLLKTALCSRRREVFTLVGIDESMYKYTFETDVDFDNPFEDLQTPMVVQPETIDLNMHNFDKYYKIEYRVSKRSVELPTVKEYWQQQVPVQGWRLETSDVQKLATSIARAVNCHARVELDEQTGIQTIYIYPAGWAEQVVNAGPTDYIIVDYQNLRKPPQVSANMLHLDMIMEPSMRPGDLIELRISEGFSKIHPHYTFEPNFSMANTTTVFAGSNFVGLAQMNEDERQKNAIASAGNIFNTQFVATFVEFRGSSHSAEWSTGVDCYGVVVNGKETSI